MKKLSIIIVNYNVCHFLEQTLLSIVEAKKDIDLEVFVVDNNSVDGSIAMLRSKFQWVRVIENKYNVGFSKANNQAIKESKGEYILLLNPDTVISEDSLEKCIDFMDNHTDAGGLGVKMVDGKGNYLPESKRGLPSPWVAFYKIFGLSALFPKSKKFGQYHLGYLDKNKTHQVEVLSGAYMFMRKSVIDQIGMLDEEYFMYGEDIDMSYRILQSGYKNYYLPETCIIHYKGESTKKSSVNYVFTFYKAMIIFAKKHFSSSNAGIFSLLIHLAIYFRAFLAISKRLVNTLTLPLIDTAVIVASLSYLSNQPAFENTPFNINQLIVLSSSWIFMMMLNHCNTVSLKLFNLIQSFVIGSIGVSLYVFFLNPEFLTNKFILLGTLFSIGTLSIARAIIHFIKYKNFALGYEAPKRILITGSNSECKRIDDLLKNTEIANQIIGYITTDEIIDIKGKYLGHIDHLNALVDLHKINEIIFCSKDLASSEIINWMIAIDSSKVDFKIVSDKSNYIIGSNSKDKRGDFYTLSINLNITSKENIRNKRIIDIVLASFFLVTSPFTLLLFKHPKTFLQNIFKVLWGNYSWVGYSNNNTLELPVLKKGIISPIAPLKKHLTLSKEDILEKNFYYAKKYHILMDIALVFKAFRELDQ